MDENRKDELELQEAEEGTQANDAPEAEKTDGLEKELEELRDMFQQELDKAADEGVAPIQALEDIDEEAAEDSADEEQEKRICECCGENECSDDFGEDYPYCTECRNLMKKYPMRWSGIAMTIVMIAVFILTAFASADYAESFVTVSDAALNYDSGKIMTGMTAYYSYVTSTDAKTISMKAVKDLLDGYAKTGYITDAANLIETVYSDAQLKLPWNKKYADRIETADVLTKTYYKVADIIEPVMAGEDYDYDEIMAELDALYETAPSEEEGIEAYNPLFIEYYRYVVMSFNEESVEDQLAQLAKVDEINDFDMEWAYLANYCAIAARAGDEALTKELFDRLVEINKEDSNAYAALASYYRWTETPDADKMLEICEQAKENLPSGDISYLPTMAIAYLLKGEGAVALEKMDEYMAQSAYTVQTCNLYALCAAYNGNEDIYNEMKSILENSGYELSDLVEKYKKDKLTIEEVLADKGGNI